MNTNIKNLVENIFDDDIFNNDNIESEVGLENMFKPILCKVVGRPNGWEYAYGAPEKMIGVCFCLKNDPFEIFVVCPYDLYKNEITDDVRNMHMHAFKVCPATEEEFKIWKKAPGPLASFRRKCKYDFLIKNIPYIKLYFDKPELYTLVTKIPK